MKAGKELEKILGYSFSVIDATSFPDWHNENTGFHILIRVHEGSVYPVSVNRDTHNPIPNTMDVLVSGNGFLMALINGMMLTESSGLHTGAGILR
ncbi:MAG: hypothetical protein DRP13_02235 [Candidatus Aenigmatarchaeota archaeon]|nr:MAG: hypothetical protein DRP13_02235 [Candidatus Aenigmarchaeota archaeon]